MCRFIYHTAGWTNCHNRAAWSLRSKNKDGGQNHSVAGRSKSGEFTCHYSPPICHVLFLREVIRARLILTLLMLSLMFRLSLLQTNCKQTDKILKFESDCVTLYVMHRCCIVDISSHTVDFQVSYTWRFVRYNLYNVYIPLISLTLIDELVTRLLWEKAT